MPGTSCLKLSALGAIAGALANHLYTDLCSFFVGLTSGTRGSARGVGTWRIAATAGIEYVFQQVLKLQDSTQP